MQLVRRVCLLRALGRHDEARTLETDVLPSTLAAVRASLDSSALPDSEVQALFEVEHLRVSEASLLAELLAQWFEGGSRGSGGSRPDSPPPAVRHNPGGDGTRTAAPAIADLLDQMLEAESRPLPKPYRS